MKENDDHDYQFYCFTRSFRDMHQTVCQGRRGLCKDMVPIDGSELLKYLRRVEFTGEFRVQ
jgi:metabotropic X receptor